MAVATSSCDSWFFENEGDCSVRYTVPITFTESFDGGNAVTNNVRSVSLYVIDREGNVVTSQSATVPRAEAGEFSMEVNVAPGTYDLLVWGQGESPADNPTAYTIGGGDYPENISQINATLPLTPGADGALSYCDRDIIPLFNGLQRNVEFPDTYGDVKIEAVNLTRDTHVFQVLVQTIDGSELLPDEIGFRIEAANSEIAYTNDVISTNTFAYRPWHVSTTSASFDTPDATPAARSDGDVNGLLAELTTGRLMADRAPRLIIRRNYDSKDVISINLIDYLLLVKGEYNRPITDQQYLDRMRYYTLMFFLDAERNWYIAGGIFINGWRVVPPQESQL